MFGFGKHYTAEEAMVCLALANSDQSVLSTLPTSRTRQQLLAHMMLKANPALKQLPLDANPNLQGTPKHKGNGFDPDDSRGFNQQGRQKKKTPDESVSVSRAQVWGRPA